ncbi:hypothetical protein F5Y14DRAFT_18428 [Nemania sp. NC0429]|nr:hypothetical protein F5Y14DRAFT_18428 [Nemania sp. NC0429]
MATPKKKSAAVRGALATPHKTTTTTTAPSSSSAAVTAEAEARAEEAAPEDQATPYSRALSRLAPLQPVLAGLAHRNRNQHRRAAWWRCFGMLRRGSARLVEDLASAVAAARRDTARAAKAAAKAKGKKRRREELASGGPGTTAGTGTGTGEEEALTASGTGTEVGVEMDTNVARRATWLRDVLVPKCYLAFSQLTADNQFAPLGVVLLGVLAQTQAACDSAAPRPAAPRPSSPSARDEITGPPPPSAAAAVAAVATGVEPETPNGGTAATIPASGTPAAPSAPEPELRPSETQRAPKGDEGASNNNSNSVGGDGGRDRDKRGREREGKAISREAVERAAELRNKGKAPAGPKARRGVRPATGIATGEEDPSGAPEATASMPSGKRRVLPSPDGAGDEGVRPAKKLKTALLSRNRGSGEGVDGGSGGDDGNGKKAEKGKEKKAEKEERKKKRTKKVAKKGDEFDDLFKDLF